MLVCKISLLLLLVLAVFLILLRKNTPDKEEDLRRLRLSVNKGVPYGKDQWVEAMAKKYHLEPTLRGAGRPQTRKDN